MQATSLPPARIAPVVPATGSDLHALLQRMTPPDAPEVLALFRVLANHPTLTERMTGWGGFLLSRRAALPLRDREIVIDRVCALCGAEYEWGVHVAAFAKAAGFTDDQVRAIADPAAPDDALTARDRLLVEAVDALHERADIGDALWTRLSAEWTHAQLLELLMLAGWYRAISYVCNAARVPLESWGARLPRSGAA
jgi:4-carboxymuconolactone decarboxylase